MVEDYLNAAVSSYVIVCDYHLTGIFHCKEKIKNKYIIHK